MVVVLNRGDTSKLEEHAGSQREHLEGASQREQTSLMVETE
jgi:hypothetical protein